MLLLNVTTFTKQIMMERRKLPLKDRWVVHLRPSWVEVFIRKCSHEHVWNRTSLMCPTNKTRYRRSTIIRPTDVTRVVHPIFFSNDPINCPTEHKRLTELPTRCQPPTSNSDTSSLPSHLIPTHTAPFGVCVGCRRLLKNCGVKPSTLTPAALRYLTW